MKPHDSPAVQSQSAPVQLESFLLKLIEFVRSHRTLSTDEKWYLFLGLRALQAELELARHRRNQKLLLPLWRRIHPHLKKLNALSGFEKNWNLRNELRFFLIGNFGTPPDQFRKRGTRFPDHDYTGKRGIAPNRLPHLERPPEETALKTYCPPTSRNDRRGSF